MIDELATTHGLRIAWLITSSCSISSTGAIFPRAHATVRIDLAYSLDVAKVHVFILTNLIPW